MPSSPVPQPVEPDGRAPASPKKRRRWRRRLAWLALAVVILLLLVNGPIFRAVVRWQLDKTLHDLYLNGDYQVTGTLVRGLELSDVDLAGKRNLRTLKIARAGVDYQLLKLIRGRWGEGVTRLHAEHIDVLIKVSEEFPTDPEIEERRAEKREKKKSKGKSAGSWKQLAALLKQDLNIEDFSVAIVSPDEPVFELDSLGFNLNAGEGTITAERIMYPNGESNESVRGMIRSSGDEIIDLSSLELAKEVTIERLTVLPPGSDQSPPRLSGELRLLDGDTSHTRHHQAPRIDGGCKRDSPVSRCRKCRLCHPLPGAAAKQ